MNGGVRRRMVGPDERREEGIVPQTGSPVSRIVGGLFPDLRAAKEAVTELKGAGFSDRQIGLAMRHQDETTEGGAGTGTRTAEEAATGAIGGGVLGALAGLLVAVGVVVVPGIGPLLAGGALASALGVTGASVMAGAGIGAAAGGFVGGLVGLDIPEPDARHFEAGIRAGRVLVLVNTGRRVEDVRAILRRHGAETDAGGQPTSGSADTTLI